MAKERDLTPYQKGVVRRYYENRDAIMSQRLGEIVSELYLCEDPKKAARLWKSAQTALMNLGAPTTRVERLLARRDLEGLAALVNELF